MATVYPIAFFKRWKCANWLYLLFAFVMLSACQSKADESSFTSPPGYNLNRPVIFKLPPALDEISGIVYNQKDHSVLAINDEHGWLYKVHLKRDIDLQKWQYYKGADFEDLALVDSTFYVLESNGNIIRFRFHTPDSAEVKEFVFPLQGRNEFEILFHDKTKRQLVLLCKDCEADDKNSLSAYAFNLDNSTYLPAPAFVIDIRKIEEIMDEKKLRFKPSAATVHPLSGDLFIISAINKVLVVTNLEGVPKAVYKVNSKLYKQPEGIAFTPRGDMLVSNEFADIGTANILFFKYQQKGSP
ncbi:MAG TPA: SdiA-regulated domain-containing protein [Chitinophagaceae bacterium]|nr:SdiA-regulated domain-containing protein [Chitinophagaceae bacterium]